MGRTGSGGGGSHSSGGGSHRSSSGSNRSSGGSHSSGSRGSFGSSHSSFSSSHRGSFGSSGSGYRSEPKTGSFASTPRPSGTPSYNRPNTSGPSNFGRPGYGPGPSPRPGHMPPPPPPSPPRPPRNYYGRSRTYYGGSGYRSHRSSPLGAILAILIIIALVAIVATKGRTNKNNNTRDLSIAKDTQYSQTIKTKLSVSSQFENNCVIDCSYQLDNVDNTAKGLKGFFNKTGVQPYIFITSYEEYKLEDYSEQERKDVAKQIFNENNLPSHAFLVVFWVNYEDDINIDYTTYAIGNQAERIMDDNALSIFKQSVEDYWYDYSLSTDKVLEKAYDKAADSIMR